MTTIKLNSRNMKMENNLNGKMVGGKVILAFTLALGLLGSTTGLHAAFSEKGAGTRAGQFLKLPVGAKAIGMGEANTALADDVNSIYYNVAGLARLEKRQVSLSHAELGGGNRHDFLAYAHPTSRATFAPVATSHTPMVSSREVLRSHFPSGLNESDQITSACASQRRRSA